MKSMRSKIRTPFLLLIVVFPLVTLLLFNVVVRVYMDRNTKSELKTVAGSIGTSFRKEVTGSLKNNTNSILDEAFAKTYKALRNTKLASSTEMLLFDRRQELLYPKSGEEGFLTEKVTSQVRSKLQKMQDGKIYTLRDGQEKYFLLPYSLTNLPGERPTIVFVSQTSGTNALLRAINLILFCVMLLGVALAALVASRLSARIARPVVELSRLTKNIGQGEFTLPEQAFRPNDITELNLLYQSIGEMSARLAAYDKSQKTFLQNASHELKTPLMSIQGYAEGIANGVMPDVKHAAEIIGGESKRLNTLVEELLTLSRIESQTYAKELISMNLSDVLKEYAQRLGGFASKLNRKLQLSLPDVPVNILADDALLSQAVMNIVSNCLRYAKTAARITLKEEQGFAVIQVTDDGGGISPTDLPHIFERFYKGKGGNFGLGLAIAKSAVEFMGGTVQAYNSENGAVFEIAIPVQK